MWYGSRNGAWVLRLAPAETVPRVGGAMLARSGSQRRCAEMGDKAKGKGKQLKKPKTAEKEKKAK